MKPTSPEDTSTGPAERLDQLLLRRGLFPTRSRARDAIMRGTVRIDGKPVVKPGQVVSAGAVVAIDDPAQAYVSRAALKLVAALDHFDIKPEGRICLDIGASTGGFTQVLLERGAARVFAVDVGHGQLHDLLGRDPRVVKREGLNARHLTADDLSDQTDGSDAAQDAQGTQGAQGTMPITLVVSDVSFISLRLALPPALALAEDGAFCVLLVKPQFEAGREAIGKGGMLRDPSSAPQVAEGLEQWLQAEMGWQSLGLIPSPIAGGDGNQEFLLAGRKPVRADPQPDHDSDL